MVVFVSPRRMMEVMGHVRGAGGRGGDMEELGGEVNGGAGVEVPHPHQEEADEWRGGMSGEANANLGEK